MSLPLFSHQLGAFDLHVFGQQSKSMTGNDVAYEQALALGASPNMVAQVITANGPQDYGHKQTYPANFGTILHADGIILRTTGSAGIIKTADCAAVLLYDERTGAGGLVHMGRAALDASLNNCANCGFTVVDNALDQLTQRQSCSSVHALVTGNICGQCFTHEDPGAGHHVEFFKRIPGAFTNESLGALDLFAVIKHFLVHSGVQTENIIHAGPCTRETPGLSSYRRGDETRNTFIAIKQQ